MTASVFLWMIRRVRRSRESSRESAGGPSSRRVAAAVLIGIVSSLPGLVPALQLVAEDRRSDTAEANRIQVFQRLPHHLDPTRFKKLKWDRYEIEAAWIGYAMLTLFWLGLHFGFPRSNSQRWFGGFVLATVFIAMGGLLVGWVPRLPDGAPDAQSALFDLRVTLMKFYPFRLCDIFVPAAAAIALTAAIESRRDVQVQRSAAARGAIRLAGGGAVFAGFLVFALVRPIPDRNPSHMKPDEVDDWIAACNWIQHNTPQDAQVRTPPSSWAFKWYAHRAEYDSYKDCPQDAKSILEWRRRQQFIPKWNDAHEQESEYSRDALRELMDQEGITHILCRKDIRFAIEPVYPRGSQKNRRFRVYRLKDILKK